LPAPASTPTTNAARPRRRAATFAARTPAFDPNGRLWLAWAEGAEIFVGSSGDLGRTFGPATRVTIEPEEIDANSESRPKIAVGPHGTIYVTYTRLGREPYTGDIRFSRSTDAGRTFSPPLTLNDDGQETGHRFDSLSVAPDGRVIVAWIDKRDLEAAKATGRAYEGAALYYAVSSDAGRTFGRNRKLKDSVCECCRLAPSFDPAGRLVLLWRDILPGGIRDHSLARIAGEGTSDGPVRATRDEWAIDACPHHGPSLAIAADGSYHAAWFTGEGPGGPGAFYARSLDAGRTFSTPVRLGEPSSQSHAVIFASGNSVVVAWKQPRASGGAAIVVRRSNDAGTTWSSPSELATTAAASDHPLLVGSGGTIYLSWFSAAYTDGLRGVAW
jgi:hypothetical protein